MTHVREYRPKYVAAHGNGPYSCFFCDTELLTLEHIHHIDEDRSNNSIENLAAAHTTCHNSHHHAGRIHTDETKSRISESLRSAYRSGRRKRPDLTGEQNPFYGKSHSEETRKKISDARAGVATGRRPSGMAGMHHTDEAKQKISEAMKARWAKKKADN